MKGKKIKEEGKAKPKKVLSEWEQNLKDLRLREAKEFRQKKKNLSDTNKLIVSNLEQRLQSMKWMHPQDSLSFGISVAEQRRNIRNRIKSIVNNSTIKI